MHARVVIYQFRPGTGDEVTRTAEAGVAPIFREHASFRSHEVVKTGPDTGISISTWDTQAQAEDAVTIGADWVKANIAKGLVSAETHLGTVSFSYRA